MRPLPFIGRNDVHINSHIFWTQITVAIVFPMIVPLSLNTQWIFTWRTSCCNVWWFVRRCNNRSWTGFRCLRSNLTNPSARRIALSHLVSVSSNKGLHWHSRVLHCWSGTASMCTDYSISVKWLKSKIDHPADLAWFHCTIVYDDNKAPSSS